MNGPIDARGLSCPQPVVLVKKALEEPWRGAVEILVDSVTSKENISRYARSAGYRVTAEERGGDYCLKLDKEENHGE